MTAAYSISPVVANFDQVDDSPQYPVGTALIGSDGRRYRYCDAGGPIAANQVDISVSTSFVATDGGGAGVGPSSAVAADQYCWVGETVDGSSVTMSREEYIDIVLDEGADPTGATDSSTEINSAHTNALAQGKIVFVPEGFFLCNAKIDYKAPMVGVGAFPFLLAGRGSRSVLVNGITNGDPLIEGNQEDYWRLENFAIQGTGLHPTEQNFVGIQMGDPNYVNEASSPTDVACTRGVMENIYIRGAKVGLEILGWNNTVKGVFIEGCETGWVWNHMNNVFAEIRTNICGRGFEIKRASGSTLHNSQHQLNGNLATTPCLIDNVSSLKLVNPYFETLANPDAHTVDFLHVGTVGPVRSIEIDGMTALGQAYPAVCVRFDDVEYAKISGRFATGDNHQAIEVTANTGYVDDSGVVSTDGFPVEPDTTNVHNQALNVFPNPYLDGIKGWSSITVSSNVAVTEETSIVKHGNKAIRIAATNPASASARSATIILDDSELLAQLSGKKCTLAGWVYLPDVVDFDQPETGSPFGRPNLGMQWEYNGAQVSTLQQALGLNWIGDANWNFGHVSFTFDALLEELRIWLYLDGSSRAVTGDEFAIFDSIFLAEGDCWRQLYQGRFQNSPDLLARIEGGRLIQRADAVPSDADFNYIIGDRVEYKTPIANGHLGEVCTTAGTGATAVFKTFGDITA